MSPVWPDGPGPEPAGTPSVFVDPASGESESVTLVMCPHCPDWPLGFFAGRWVCAHCTCWWTSDGDPFDIAACCINVAAAGLPEAEPDPPRCLHCPNALVLVRFRPGGESWVCSTCGCLWRIADGSPSYLNRHCTGSLPGLFGGQWS